MSLVGPVFGEVDAPPMPVLSDQQSGGTRSAVIVDFDYSGLPLQVAPVEFEIKPAVVLGKGTIRTGYLEAGYLHGFQVQPHGGDSILTHQDVHARGSGNSVAFIGELDGDLVVSDIEGRLASVRVGVDGRGQEGEGDPRKQHKPR